MVTKITITTLSPCASELGVKQIRNQKSKNYINTTTSQKNVTKSGCDLE